MARIPVTSIDEIKSNNLIVVPATSVAAAAINTSKDPSRPILGDVQVEQGPDGTSVVATDSYCLSVILHEKLVSENENSVLVPIQLIKDMKVFPTTPKAGDLLAIAEDKSTHGFAMRFSYYTATSNAKMMQAGPFCVVDVDDSGNYPDWKRLVPTTPNLGETAVFNTSYLARLDRMVELLLKNGSDKYGRAAEVCNLDGHSPILFSAKFGGTELKYLVMPVRK